MTDAEPRPQPPDQPGGHPDHEGFAERVERKTGKTVQEVFTVLVISLTAVLTAWCGFESSKWGGEMSIAFSQASSARIQAASAQGTVNTSRQFDLTIWGSYVEAVAADDTRLADYIRDRFTNEFHVAYDDWLAHDRALPSPFKEPSYIPPGTKDYEALTTRADAKFQQALDNNAQGDRYSLLVVLFALVLFFAAMSGRDFAAWVSRAFLGIATVLLVVGGTVLLTFPVIV